MRKIIQWDTTFINRENTNAKRYTEVNHKIQETTANINITRKTQGKNPRNAKKIITFAEVDKIMKTQKN